MTKKELIDKVADGSGITKKQVESVLSLVVDAIRSSERTEIRGLGVFKFKVRAARQGRNPITGEALEIPEKTVLAFKAGK